MGEFKVSHPDAYALDALCQNFLTTKRKLNERDIEKIMEKEMVEPIVPAPVQQPVAPKKTTAVKSRRRSARTSTKNSATGERVEANDTASSGTVVTDQAGQSIGSGSHSGMAQGINQVVAHGNNATNGTDGGMNTQNTSVHVQSSGQNNHSEPGNAVVAVTGQGHRGNNVLSTQAAQTTRLEMELQHRLLQEVQKGALIPYGCPPEHYARYQLDPAQAYKLVNATYAEFQRNRVTLCYVRVSLDSRILPAEQCLFVIYVPRVPRLQELKDFIVRGLEQSKKVPESRLGRIYCVLDGTAHEEIQDLLTNDAKVHFRFSQLAWEQSQQRVPGELPLGARLLPLIQVDLEPAIPELPGNIQGHGTYVGPAQNGHAQGSHVGPAQNGHAQGSYAGHVQNVHTQGSYTGPVDNTHHH